MWKCKWLILALARQLLCLCVGLSFQIKHTSVCEIEVESVGPPSPACPPNLSILINDPLIVAKCQLSLATETTQVHRCRRTRTQTQTLCGHQNQTTSSHLWALGINTLLSICSAHTLKRTTGRQDKTKVKMNTYKKVTNKLLQIISVSLSLFLQSVCLY